MNIRDFTALLQGRASHRKLTSEPVADETVRTLIDCARLAPSGHNFQPWRFIAMRNPRLLQQLADAVGRKVEAVLPALPAETAAELSRYRFFLEHFRASPLTIAVVSRETDYVTTQVRRRADAAMPATGLLNMTLLGVGAAINNLLLAAQALGYGTCWLTGPLDYAQPELEALLDIAPPEHLVSLITVGRPQKEKGGAPRKGVDELLSWRD